MFDARALLIYASARADDYDVSMLYYDMFYTIDYYLLIIYACLFFERAKIDAAIALCRPEPC